MVRALLAGTKTQTRRVLKPQPEDRMWSIYKRFPRQNGLARWNVGDHLWVREQWSGLHVFHDTPPAERKSFVGDGWPYLREDILYWADGNPDCGDWERPRPSIHMPRWASRLTLTVIDVRVERVQDISEADAKAEGLKCVTKDSGRVWKWGIPDRDGWPGTDDHGWPWDKWCVNPCDAYACLWDTINGADAWTRNDWVSVTTFTVEQGPPNALA